MSQGTMNPLRHLAPDAPMIVKRLTTIVVRQKAVIPSYRGIRQYTHVIRNNVNLCLVTVSYSPLLK